jgi:hypothetical protein
VVDHRITAETLSRLQENNFGTPTQSLGVLVGNTENVNTLDTTGQNKTCKWIVTIKTADGRISICEVLAVYKAPPLSPIYSVYAKIGDTVSYNIVVTSTASDMTLTVQNTDISNFVSVDVIRLQHYA